MCSSDLTDNTTIIDYGTITGTSKNIIPTANTIYELTPNSNTYKARYILTTTQNSKTYTNTKDFIFNVTNSEPTFSNFTYQDTNNITNELTGDNQILIEGYSNVKGIINTSNKAIAKNSATMKKYKMVIGNKTENVDYSSNNDVSVIINNINSATIDMFAIDSRGNTTKVSKTAPYKQYTDLTIKSVKASRSNNGVGQEVTLSYEGSYWAESFGKITNEIKSIRYQYKQTTSNTWIDGETSLTHSSNNGRSEEHTSELQSH